MKRCEGCYNSFSGWWCENCDQWPCKCAPILERDLRTAVYSSGDKRITRVVHVPTGLVVDCGDYETDVINRNACIDILTEKMGESKDEVQAHEGTVPRKRPSQGMPLPRRHSPR